MALHLGTSTAGTSQFSLQDFEPSWGAKMNAAVREAWLESYGPAATDYARSLLADDGSPKLSAAEAEAVVKESGLKVPKLSAADGKYTRSQLDVLLERQRELHAIRDVRDRTPWGVGSVVRGAAMFGAGIVDPLNLATAFVPWTRAITALNGIRAATMAESFATRTAARAALGGADAGISTALLEPAYFAVRQELGDDYGMLDSLANIAFGTAFGGGIHSGGGAALERMVRLFGKTPEFERYRGLSNEEIQLVQAFRREVGKGGLTDASVRAVLDSYTPAMRRAAGFPDADIVPGSGPASAAARAAGMVTGRETRIRIGDTYEPAVWSVIDADDLQATVEKADNQFRDRSRAAYQAEIQQRANNLDFNLLAESPVMDYGAPTLAADGRIIGGNGRALFISRAYEIGKGADYRAALEAKVAELGIEVETVRKMRRPVLVRVLQRDVDVRRAAMLSNEGGSTDMSPLEQAKVDAERLGDSVLEVGPDGDLNAPANRAAIRKWVEAQPENKRNSLVDDDGRLSQTGLQRLNAALMYKAYGDSPVLGRLIESMDQGSRNIALALGRTAGVLAAARARIASGDLHPLDIADDLQMAVEKYNQLREQGMKIADYFAQLDAFGDGLTPEARLLLDFMGRNIGSPRRIADMITGFYDRLDEAGNPKQADMFGGVAAPDKTAMLQDAISGAEQGLEAAADVVANLAPETREAALRASVAQSVDGREVDVDAIVGMDESLGTATIEDVVQAAARNMEPENQPLADFAASEAVQQRVDSAPRWRGLADAEAAAAEADTVLSDVVAAGDQAFKYSRGEGPGQKKAVLWQGTTARFQPEEGAPFGRFRWDFINSEFGEGAQAFGYGHYLAQQAWISQEMYRERLVRRDQASDRYSIPDGVGGVMELSRRDSDPAWVMPDGTIVHTSQASPELSALADAIAQVDHQGYAEARATFENILTAVRSDATERIAAMQEQLDRWLADGLPDDDSGVVMLRDGIAQRQNDLARAESRLAAIDQVTDPAPGLRAERDPDGYKDDWKLFNEAGEWVTSVRAKTEGEALRKAKGGGALRAGIQKYEPAQPVNLRERVVAGDEDLGQGIKAVVKQLLDRGELLESGPGLVQTFGRSLTEVQKDVSGRNLTFAIDDVIRALDQSADLRAFNNAEVDEFIGRLRDIQSRGVQSLTLEMPGSLYRAEMDVDVFERLMLWDAPMSEQPQVVRDAFERWGLDEESSGFDSPSKFSYSALVDFINDGALDETDDFMSAVMEIANRRGLDPASVSPEQFPADEIASVMLHQAGVPGHAFLDGQSRRAGEGTYNIVVYSDDVARIVDRYARQTGEIGRATDDPAQLTEALRLSFGKSTDALVAAGRIQIVATPADIPGGPHPADVKAATAPDGTVYMVASNISVSEARGLVLHEVGVHVGMEQMLGPEVFRSVLSQLDDAVVRGEDWAMAARAAVPADTRAGLVREEQLAYLVQNAPELPIVQRIIAAVRAWAYRTFEGLRDRMTLTEADFRALAVSALHAAARGEAGAGSMVPAFARRDGFSDLGILNSPTPPAGMVRVTDIPFYGDSVVKQVLDAADAKDPDWRFDLADYSFEDVPRSKIVSMQPWVDESAIRLQSDGPSIFAVKYGDEYFVFNGTHRTIGHLRAGDETVNMKVFDATGGGAVGLPPTFARDVAQVGTKAFRDWFGDSKVVDADGEPLVVYHGARPGVDIESFRARHETDGIYFTPDVSYAESYTGELFSGEDASGAIYPVYLSIKNPYVVEAEYGSDAWNSFVDRGLNRLDLKRQGFDGAILREPDGTVDQIIAFEPEQIKSAIGNRGTFDPTNPDIRYSRGETPDPSTVADEIRPYEERIARAKQFAPVLRAAAEKLENDAQAVEAMRAALPDITPQEINDLLDQLRRQVKGLRNVTRSVRDSVRAADVANELQPEAMKAADELANNIEMAAVIEKRNAQLNIAARLRASSFLNQFRDSKLDFEGFRGLLVGTERRRVGGRLSVDAEQKQFRGEWLGGMIADLEKEGLMRQFASGEFDRDIYVAMYNLGRDGDVSGLPAEAVSIAKIVSKYQEDARNTRNRFGAWIRDLSGYIVRQSHDMFKIRDAGERAFKEFVLPRLDVERTLRDFDGSIDDFLTRVYDDFASGSHMKTPAGEDDLPVTGMGSSLAKRESQSRVLYFKDGNAAFEYNEKFGQGRLAESVLHGLEHAARSAGLLKVLGTNPEATVMRLFDEYADSLRGDPQRRASFLSHRKELQNLLAHVDGSANIPGNFMGARVGSFLRSWQTMAKLGGMLISSISDLTNYAAEIRFGQDRNLFSGLMDSIGAVVRGRASGERQAILNSLGVFHESTLGAVLNRFDNPDLMGGKTAALMQQYFKLTGINWWTESLRDGYVLSHSNYLASNAVHKWGDLPASLRDMLGLYNIDEGKWDVLRIAALTEADGRKYMTPEGLQTVPYAALENYIQSMGRTPSEAAVQNLRDDLAGALRAMMIDRMHHAVIEPNARVRAFMQRGTQPGTVSGEFLRFIGQFKSFPVSVIQMALGREIYGRGYDTLGDYLRRGKGDMLGLVTYLVMSTMLGYGAMSIKDMLRGKNPRPVDDPTTWAAAMIQGGGLGIYGDFLFGKFNRMGGTLTGSAVGPVGNLLDTAADLWTRIRSGDDFAASAFQAALQNTPFLNLFYLRTALDYLFLYQIQEALNPGYLRRMERRVERENGQTFFLPPSQVVR